MAVEELDLSRLAAELASTADVANDAARGFVRALYEEVGRGAFRNHLTRDQLAVLLRLVRETVDDDLLNWQRTATESFASFQERLLAVSVERPPRADGILDPVQATAACDCVLKTYYQQFNLYRRACARTPRLDLAQRTTCDVEPPLVAPPLARAVQLG